jgi:hypothetical protein
MGFTTMYKRRYAGKLPMQATTNPSVINITATCSSPVNKKNTKVPAANAAAVLSHSLVAIFESVYVVEFIV